jgi:hypothetical protein
MLMEAVKCTLLGMLLVKITQHVVQKYALASFSLDLSYVGLECEKEMFAVSCIVTLQRQFASIVSCCISRLILVNLEYFVGVGLPASCHMTFRCLSSLYSEFVFHRTIGSLAVEIPPSYRVACVRLLSVPLG